MPDFVNEDYGIIKCQCDRCGIGMEYNRYMERPQLAFSIGYQYGVPKYTFTLCSNCLSDFKEARKEAETMYVERMMDADNELDLYFPYSEYNGEDCIIIPISQIVSMEIETTCDTFPEMTLTVRGKRQ